MLIDLFIKAKWHTVPLQGELKRLESGKKTLPIFETDWKRKYTDKFNEKKTRVAAAITGHCSGIVALDCDNQLTYDMFKAFDPEYKFHFVSKGKPEGGGTIIYKYHPDLGTFKLNTEQLKLDFFSDEGAIYLPTEDNHTKESWANVKELPELKEMPEAIVAMLRALKAKLPAITYKNELKPKTVISNRLAPMLETFVKSKKYDPILFRVLTPYSFRDLPSYVTKGHLHPNDVPKGRGSEYISKISAILGADISVNTELYTNTIMLINSLWDEPMDKPKLMATIINPMIEGRSAIDGEPIWQYDNHWEQMGFIATALNGDYIESFYDDIKGIYYLVNYTVPYIKGFSDKRPLLTTIKTLLGRQVTETQYDSTKQLIRTSLNPNLEFGHVEGSDNFNIFRQTIELAILNNPDAYKDQYNRPNTIIKYFESLIPDDYMRMFVLSFIKTKLTTFNYSPVILYLIGKPGSGKDTLVGLLRAIIGGDYIAKPDTKVFLEQYNGWMIDKFFIQLDEYGNKLTRQSEKEECLGKLKAYTGAENIQIRAMRTDGYNYRHRSTFIMTANRNPLPVETDDRRVAFIKTPNRLDKQDWVRDMGGISIVQDRIKVEIQDFCYFLATEIPLLKGDDYVIAPETEDKERLILNNLPAAEQIMYYISKSRWDELAEVAEDYGVSDFTEGWEQNKLDDGKLEKLYELMTDGAGSHRTIVKCMRDLGYSRSHTTSRGMNVFYYMITDLKKFKDTTVEFKPIENVEKIKPKGL